MVINDSSAQPSRSSAIMASTSSTSAAAIATAAPTKNAADDSGPSITVNPKPAPVLPAPKTDKPRPHVCATCSRSFARLEHLKRHERSHTKEKPFECPECARCFARRDLLLRHQQKLHQTTTPSARPRNRRESASGGTPAQARRKNSLAGASLPPVAGQGSAQMRPRANTISHVDGSAMQMLASANAPIARSMHGGGHNRHPSLLGLPLHNFDFGGMSLALGQRGMHLGLSKLETGGNVVDMDLALRTAPHIGPFGTEFDFENFLFGHGSTINPNALHYNDSPQSMNVDQQSPFSSSINDLTSTQPFDENLDWVTGFEHQMTFQSNENVIDGSSPSAISTTSQSGISDVMVDGSNHPAPAGTSTVWQPSVMGPPQMTNPFAMDLNGSVFPDLLNGAPVSPQPVSQKINDSYLSAQSSMNPSVVTGPSAPSIINASSQSYHAGPADPMRPMAAAGNRVASPVTTITDVTRTAIVKILSQSQPFGRKPILKTAPQASSNSQLNELKLPSAQDLRRYVTAYLLHFHPHLPFLHVPSLNFDMSDVLFDDDQERAHGGRGCLVLATAMIGALYEREFQVSKQLFDLSKNMVILFLQQDHGQPERSRAEARRSTSSSGSQPSAADDGSSTPVWLVQTMLLNVSYGHNVMDKTCTDIASMHISSLVGLAQGAQLMKPMTPVCVSDFQDLQMADDDDGGGSSTWDMEREQLRDQKWLEWTRMEERKRTLYAVFLVSSILVTAYNHAPALTNSDILLDLPCDEEFYAAESSADFFARGGVGGAAHNTPPFLEALAALLHAHQSVVVPGDCMAAMKMSPPHEAISRCGRLADGKLSPSPLGLLMLIYALHNYIWEARQRQPDSQAGHAEGTQRMRGQMEPALRAWQIAWTSNPRHCVERPNPYGLGPLSADSIPLLDLAYVGLYVDLSQAKERLWERDWAGVTQEISRGSQVMEKIQQEEEPAGADKNSSSNSNINSSSNSDINSSSNSNSNNNNNNNININSNSSSRDELDMGGGVMVNSPSAPPAQSMDFADLEGLHVYPSPGEVDRSRREKNLRKASFFAADSLAMADRLGVSVADMWGGELPLQSALCAFDCLQVLAEWVATLQDRVGPYLGVVGEDEVDFGQMPAIMMLEEDDVRLLEKVRGIVQAMESKARDKLAVAAATTATAEGGSGNDDGMGGLRLEESGGYVPKLLGLFGIMMKKAGVWQVYQVLGQCLEEQTVYARERARRSATTLMAD